MSFIRALAWSFLPILFTANLLYGQNRMLQQKMTLDVKNERLDKVLNKMAEKGNFSFSYSGALLNTDSLVTVNYINLPVWDILDQLFKGNVEYYELDGYIILRSAVNRFYIDADEIRAEDKRYIIKGKVLDVKTGLGVKNASVYEKQLLKSALTDKNGVFRLRFTGNHKSVVLTASKTLYKDTTMFFLADIKVLPEGVIAEDSRQSNFYKSGFNNMIEQSGMGRFFVSSKRRIQSLNIPDFFVNNRVQASLVPGLGSQGLMSSQVVNTVSFNVLGGYSAGVTGFETAGLFNLTKNDIDKSFQLAGLFNQVGGHVSGMQTAGILNTVYDGFQGLQLAGITNQVKKDFKGFQVSGIFNRVGGKLQGTQLTGIVNQVNENVDGSQLSGIYNYTSKNFRGFQFSGIFNHVKGESAEGIQISGVLNKSKNFKGFQFGLINLADTLDGVGLGLFNIYKNGYKKLSVYTDELLNSYASFRSGNANLYTIWEVGANWKDKERFYMLNVGLGHDFLLGEKTLLSAEFVHVMYVDGAMDALGNSTKFIAALEQKLNNKLGLVVGATYQLYERDLLATKELPVPSWASTINRNSKSWLGGKLGLVYYF